MPDEIFTPSLEEVVKFYRERLAEREHETACTVAVAKQLRAERDALKAKLAALESIPADARQ